MATRDRLDLQAWKDLLDQRDPWVPQVQLDGKGHLVHLDLLDQRDKRDTLAPQAQKESELKVLQAQLVPKAQALMRITNV